MMRKTGGVQMMRSALRTFCLAAVLCLLCTAAWADADSRWYSGGIYPGAQIVFGAYEQDGSRYNGSEPVTWLVLETDGDSALLVSNVLLDCVQYHSWNGAIAWRDADIRRWLNSDFYYSAFTAEERNCILSTYISQCYDKVFMLSSYQIQKYGLSQTGCETSAYAAARGVQIGTDNGKGCWWVQMDVTRDNGNAQFVGIHGKIYDTNRVTIGNNGVRPAIMVSIRAMQGWVNPGGSTVPSDPDIAPAAGYTGYTNQKIATRCGPSTDYDETHTYNLPVGTAVRVLRYQVTRGTPWVEIEFQYGNEWVRAWTGKKRIDCPEAVYLSGDYDYLYSGYLDQETPGWFGPGSGYRVLYTSIPSGTSVEILGESGSWCLIQFSVSGHQLIHRAWIPMSRLSYSYGY